MSTKTDPTPSSPSAESAAAPTRKPRTALLVATAGGVGYIPVAPGTWGSLVGLLAYELAVIPAPGLRTAALGRLSAASAVGLLLALGGLLAADRAAKFLRQKDPGCVVIDEVSGQFLTYLLALAPLNWKYLVLGLILFRAFDIWKPAPARQAESLPGGLGIMADDWVAGIYAAIGLWVARAAGL